MTWHAQLDINYSQEQQRSVARHTHSGPLRLLQSLYPEGHAVCHNVLVHPPGGLVGGDTLDITVAASGAAHGLITTPGATRFYRSAGEPAVQRTQITLRDQARLEWLPLETIAYNQCLAENHLTLNLAPQAECMGWDITALGLPAAELPFAQGRLLQHLELPGVWLERGLIDASDTRLLDGPLGLAGQRCMATLFFAAGTALDKPRRAAALDMARQVLDGHALRGTAGATCPNPQVLVVRVLSPLVEPAVELLRQVWVNWRAHFWGLPATLPRIWST
ncbi:urease accessory protein UreD [Rhodoferax sp.]|uniref:urease accessory protein UreD n=1 Tax=Rhodoferax sp. TaxID=50421 RepID=UPI002617276C|nr:urease accessory protein UreD [Rhodoferax sp.]MDD2809055.1 urease accessory protein UreD [Rhodoferax sp.]